MSGERTAALTEREVIDRLRVKYGETAGNGAAWAFIPQVRSAAAFDSRRTIDAYAMSLWPSRGLTLTAFEIKSSRSDWQRELKNPEKAEEFCERADYFYLVTGDKDIVRPGELPEPWGLLVPHGKGLRVVKEAPRLRAATINGGAPADGRHVADLPPAFSRSFLAALLRAATAVGSATPEAIVAARNEARDAAETLLGGERDRLREQVEKLRADIATFTQASGINPLGYSYPDHDPAEVGRAVRLVLRGEHQAENLTKRLTRLREEAQRIGGEADALLPSAVS